MATGLRISAKRRFGQVKWGGPGTSFETGPGDHTVAMSFRYLGRACGGASAEVDVAPGQEVAPLCRSPWVVTGKGSLTVQ